MSVVERVEFVIVLDDGREAVCWQAQSQPYMNCTLSAGLVRGIEPDTLYLRLEREGEEPTTLFFRSDEMLAVVWVASGALWSQAMLGKS